MTDTITHHLTQDLLMGYSAGTLPEAVNLLVATHLSICDDCRAAVASFDALGGAVLADASDPALPEPEMSVDFAATMALIQSGAANKADRPAHAPDPVIPAPLQDYIGGGLDAVKWRPVGMGVKQAILKTSPEASARLLFIPAGSAVPDHSHGGLELTLVLKGAFEDEQDRFARGDVEIADEDLHHMPVADISEDCICLAVTDAPLKFKGLLPRIAQPFLRI